MSAAGVETHRRLAQALVGGTEQVVELQAMADREAPRLLLGQLDVGDGEAALLLAHDRSPGCLLLGAGTGRWAGWSGESLAGSQAVLWTGAVLGATGCRGPVGVSSAGGRYGGHE